MKFYLVTNPPPDLDWQCHGQNRTESRCKRHAMWWQADPAKHPWWCHTHRLQGNGF